MAHIIKRKGHRQEFDERKVYASVYAACLSSHLSKEEAEDIANQVAKELGKWIENKEGVTSDEIFKAAAEELMALNKDASFMYTTHRDVS